MKIVRFKVMSYALFDALFALENTRDSHRYIEYSVGKEDDEIWIYAKEIYIPKLSNECMEAKDCCAKCEG